MEWYGQVVVAIIIFGAINWYLEAQFGKEKAKPISNLLWIIVVIILAITGLQALAASMLRGEPQPNTPASASIEPTKRPRTTEPVTPVTVEHMLATLQRGPISASDPLVLRFARELDELSAKCTDSRTLLADYTTVSYQRLKKRGIEESYLTIISSVNAAVPPKPDKWDCAQMFAAYVVLRIRG